MNIKTQSFTPPDTHISSLIPNNLYKLAFNGGSELILYLVIPLRDISVTIPFIVHRWLYGKEGLPQSLCVNTTVKCVSRLIEG